MEPTPTNPPRPATSPAGSTPADPRHAQTFLDRFRLKVRDAEWVVHPLAGNGLQVDPKTLQAFERSFGRVVQYPLESGMWPIKKVALVLSAVALGDRAYEASEHGPRPVLDILQRVVGGLDLEDGVFYCVGLFSPRGWPEDWKRQAHARDNAHFYLVERRPESTQWSVFGPKDGSANLAIWGFFNPETEDERWRRLAQALEKHPDLLLPSSLITLQPFLDEHEVERADVEEVVKRSGGRFRIIDHRGRSAVQRAIS